MRKKYIFGIPRSAALHLRVCADDITRAPHHYLHNSRTIVVDRSDVKFFILLYRTFHSP